MEVQPPLIIVALLTKWIKYVSMSFSPCQIFWIFVISIPFVCHFNIKSFCSKGHLFCYLSCSRLNFGRHCLSSNVIRCRVRAQTPLSLLKRKMNYIVTHKAQPNKSLGFFKFRLIALEWMTHFHFLNLLQ